MRPLYTAHIRPMALGRLSASSNPSDGSFSRIPVWTVGPCMAGLARWRAEHNTSSVRRLLSLTSWRLCIFWPQRLVAGCFGRASGEAVFSSCVGIRVLSFMIRFLRPGCWVCAPCHHRYHRLLLFFLLLLPLQLLQQGSSLNLHL